MRPKSKGGRGPLPKRSPLPPDPKPTSKGTPTTFYEPKSHRHAPAIRRMAKMNWSPRKIAKQLDLPLDMVNDVLAGGKT